MSTISGRAEVAKLPAELMSKFALCDEVNQNMFSFSLFFNFLIIFKSNKRFQFLSNCWKLYERIISSRACVYRLRYNNNTDEQDELSDFIEESGDKCRQLLLKLFDEANEYVAQRKAARVAKNKGDDDADDDDDDGRDQPIQFYHSMHAGII